MRHIVTVLTILMASLMPGLVAQAGAQPPAEPDLSGYTAVPSDAFTTGGDVFFQTPNGLCAILLSRNAAGCDGVGLSAAEPAVNQIVLTADPRLRGLRATTDHRAVVGNFGFVKATPGAAPVLHDGEKLIAGDFECAVGPGARTACTKGTPVSQWMVISPGRTGIGPGTTGLADGFPDPDEFVLGEGHIVGSGALNLFPVFTVDGGLTCTIHVFSGGEFGCDGPLPGVADGMDEVYTRLGGSSGVRHSGQPKLATPANPGTISRLPVGFKVYGESAVCLAIPGGVACSTTYTSSRAQQGFTVSPAGTTTFGGS